MTQEQMYVCIELPFILLGYDVIAMKIFIDLIGKCLAWDSRSHLRLIFWSFFFLGPVSNYLFG